ncbi:MAG: hypothetical protein ABIS01_12325 [Ferruginibacter sp.]
MKTIFAAKPLLLKMILLFACFVLAAMVNVSKAEETPAVARGNSRLAVNFVQNEQRDELAVSVKSSSKAIMQLFLFSLDGILVKEVAVSTHTITTIKGLKRGYYQYECFNNDERMKSGSLLIK